MSGVGGTFHYVLSFTQLSSSLNLLTDRADSHSTLPPRYNGSRPCSAHSLFWVQCDSGCSNATPAPNRVRATPAAAAPDAMARAGVSPRTPEASVAWPAARDLRSEKTGTLGRRAGRGGNRASRGARRARRVAAVRRARETDGTPQTPPRL